jgi:hypothetical protein
MTKAEEIMAAEKLASAHLSLLVMLADWREKMRACDDYINGDSDKFPGEDGWVKLHEAVDLACDLLARLRAKE